MKTRFGFLALLAIPFLLTACGEGWEMQRVTNIEPYGNSRTAGSGIIYVRTKLMPERSVNVKPMATPVERHRDVPQVATQPPSPAEKVFKDHQKKK